MFPILAHGSGVDDLLWFVVPLVVLMALLRYLEKKRVGRSSKMDRDE